MELRGFIQLVTGDVEVRISETPLDDVVQVCVGFDTPLQLTVLTTMSGLSQIGELFLASSEILSDPDSLENGKFETLTKTGQRSHLKIVKDNDNAES